MPADDAVAVWLDAYRPDAVPAPVWDGGLSEFVGGLVKELDVGLESVRPADAGSRKRPDQRTVQRTVLNHRWQAIFHSTGGAGAGAGIGGAS